MLSREFAGGAIPRPFKRWAATVATTGLVASIPSPAIRIDLAVTIPPSDMTATSVVPPPISTTMLPVGSHTGRSAPIAAANGSSIV